MKKYIATYTVTYTAEFDDQENAMGFDPIEHAEQLYEDFEIDLDEHETKVEEIREDENGAWLTKDENGRYVNKDGNYGYNTHFGGLYVCYTCGHLCECEEAEEAPKIGADGSEVVWFSELTEKMLENMDDGYLDELLYLLNKAVERICTDYGVN